MTTAVRISDGLNDAAFASFEECVSGLQSWFDYALEASCQGLSEVGIEEMFPGLQDRLREAVLSVSVPTSPGSLADLAEYASALEAKVRSICRTDDERQAVGVPAQFSLRYASPLEVPDFEALAKLREQGR